MLDGLLRRRNICWLQACTQRSFSISPYERRVRGRAAVLAIQHLLGLLAILFQHEVNINPAFADSMLGQFWIVWLGLYSVLAQMQVEIVKIAPYIRFSPTIFPAHYKECSLTSAILLFHYCTPLHQSLIKSNLTTVLWLVIRVVVLDF